jgi:transcriptional regulator GlxA family with amidase domain
MAGIIEAPGFEELANVLRGALDDFMNNIYLMGYRPPNAAVQKTLEYLAEHFRDPVALSDVAEAVGLSSCRVAHLVKEHTGRSVLQHVHRMRVQEAQRLLEQTSMPCAEIAYETGFSDQSYFTKQFRLLSGTTPARYRRTRRNPRSVSA